MKLHNILVFDLDGTLAELGQGMTADCVELLQKLEKMGYQIAICSGKPTYYLCGFMRQVGIKHPILLGENGATVQFGVDLPPEQYYVNPAVSDDAREQIRLLRSLFDQCCGANLWYQPNEVALTPFPKTKDAFDAIQKIVEDQAEEIKDLLVYRHIDSFDITPKEITKYSGLEWLANDLLCKKRTDFIAIGDGVNDIPMFEFAEVSIGIGSRLDYRTDYSFSGIRKALEFLLAVPEKDV